MQNAVPDKETALFGLVVDVCRLCPQRGHHLRGDEVLQRVGALAKVHQQAQPQGLPRLQALLLERLGLAMLPARH